MITKRYDIDTLIALREAREHWRRMAAGERIGGETPSGEFCSLCDMFADAYADDPCEGCPVAEAGHPECDGSPYHAAHNAWRKHGIDSPEFKAAAQKELEFLESLLPENAKAST